MSVSLKEIADNLRRLADEIEALGPHNPAQPRLPLGEVADKLINNHTVRQCWKCSRYWLLDFYDMHLAVCGSASGITDNG